MEKNLSRFVKTRPNEFSYALTSFLNITLIQVNDMAISEDRQNSIKIFPELSNICSRVKKFDKL